jgi:hypothetical protein
MTQSSYSLEVISHHPSFKNKSLRKYYVDGIDTVGAWGDEPFEIKFTNHTWQKVQVKISLDGTDILSGVPATTDVDNNMWVVNGYGTMTLKAWPETNNGGAQFLFTSANNSVAVHTHGDLSARGIIAAAVFVEGHVEPIRLTPAPIVVREDHHHYHDYYRRNRDYWTGPVWIGGGAFDGSILGGSYNSNVSNVIPTSSNAVFNNSNVLHSRSLGEMKCSLNANDQNLGEAEVNDNLETLVAVGAGQHVDQKINYVAGLIKPAFTQTVRVRYMWWDDLVVKLRENNVPASHASGFPGDKKKININLGNTPRFGGYQKEAFPRSQPVAPVYTRV